MNNYNKTAPFLRGINLASSDLSNVYFDNPNMTNVNLEGANLNLFFIQGGFMNYARLKSANLKDADFRGTEMHHANLESSILQNATLVGCDLNCASMVNAVIDSINLAASRLDGLRFFQFSKDSIINNKDFMLSLKSKKTVHLKELTQRYFLRKYNSLELKKICHPESFKNGKEVIRIGERSNLRHLQIRDSVSVIYALSLNSGFKFKTNFYKKSPL